MPQLFMGIDQSYTSSGVIVLDENRNMVHSQIISSSKEDDIFERAYNVAFGIATVVDQFKPAFIGIEGLAFSMIGNATRDLAGLQFTIIQRLRYTCNYKDKIVIVAPNELKKYATSNGKADKQAMFNSLPQTISDYLKTHYKKTKGLFDVTDAYWIAKYAADVADKRQTS